MRRVYICHLQHSYPHGQAPGWYWWHAVPMNRTVTYHGPFETEDECRRDMIRHGVAAA